ncbi:MAG: LacI family DNA-binding transcriptional regulator [Opitutaceae bacterium]
MSTEAPKHTVTQMDLARALGVSGATISLALNGSPKISEACRAKILATAKEMGYRPNAAASNLAHSRNGSAKTQAVIAWINYWRNPQELNKLAEYDRYWLGASEAAEDLGYKLEEFKAYGTTPARLCQILRSRGIDGILLPPHIEPTDWTGFEWNHFSVIRLGRSIHQLQGHVVSANQVANTILAFEKIQEKGYERIGFITSPPDSNAALSDAGFLRAQRQAPENQHVPICSILNESDEVVVSKIKAWVLKNKPDAILTNVQRVPSALKSAGFRIPEDIALASLSTLDIDSDSGIYQNPRNIGKVAMHKVIAQIKTNAYGIPDESNETQVRGIWVDGKDMPSRSN